MMNATPLISLAALADESEAQAIALEARGLLSRATEGRFYVACVGQFKRGKSTVINALVGAPVLPTGVAPVTSVPTVVRFGERALRVSLAGGETIAVAPGALAEWVTEAGNPANRKQVVGVEVFEPSPLLAAGLCLVDTAGLGSVFDASTRSTHEFVPQIDAVIAVLGVDPPITLDELDLIARLRAQAEHVVVLMNKVDRFGVHERAEAAAFTERALRARLGRFSGPLLEISALSVLRRTGGSGDWQTLVQTLERMSTTSGHALRAGALERGRERLGRRLERVLTEQREALLRPIEESERRVRELSTVSVEADRALAELAPLLGLDQQRVSLSFGSREHAFLSGAVPAAVAELHGRLALVAPAGTRLRRRAALEVANDVARARVEPWLAESEQAADVAYREAVAGFVARAGALRARVAAADPTEAADLGLHDDRGGMRATGSGFYFTDLLRRHLPANPWIWVGDALSTRERERRRVTAAAEAYVNDLLRVNASRVRGDLDDRLGQSRHRLEAQLRVALHEGRDAAVRALDRARGARSAGQAATARELAEIDARLARLQVAVGRGPLPVPA